MSEGPHLHVTSKGVYTKFETWLELETEWQSSDEFFTALLFETGKPPVRFEKSIYPTLMPHEWMAWKEWRSNLSDILSHRLHHSVDRTHVATAFFAWIAERQINGNSNRADEGGTFIGFRVD